MGKKAFSTMSKNIRQSRFLDQKEKERIPILRIPVSKLREGMVLAQTIYNNSEGSVLTRGTALTARYIEHLRRMEGLTSVTVMSANGCLDILPPPDIVQNATRSAAVNCIQSFYTRLDTITPADVKQLEHTIDLLLEDVMNRGENLVQLTDIRMYDSYTFSHCVNVAILSAMLGMLCEKYSYHELEALTLGAILHDIGKMDIPPAVLNKRERLTDEEFQLVRKHTAFGARRIRSLADKIPHAAIVENIAYSHHEHIDGRGYPRHLNAKSIHPFAKVVAIADVYDALTSERPYKKAYAPHLAYKIMTSLLDGQFDPDLLQLFFDNVAIYPIGTVLKTRLGYAVVLRSAFRHTRTPLIRVFADNGGHRMSHYADLDLSCVQDGASMIQSVLQTNDVLHFIQDTNINPDTYLSKNMQNIGVRCQSKRA